jgi:hypothetical protein
MFKNLYVLNYKLIAAKFSSQCHSYRAAMSEVKRLKKSGRLTKMEITRVNMLSKLKETEKVYEYGV